MSKLSDAAFCVGDRSASSARELWQCIPQGYRDHATFYKDYQTIEDVLTIINSFCVKDLAAPLPVTGQSVGEMAA